MLFFTSPGAKHQPTHTLNSSEIGHFAGPFVLSPSPLSRSTHPTHPARFFRHTEAAAGEKRAPALEPRPATTTTSAACRTPASASYNPSFAPAALRQDVRTGNNAVGIFSAEGSWDPVFVIAPPRLVGLQNQTAARRRGRRRARQVAWRRIDRPEVK